MPSPPQSHVFYWLLDIFFLYLINHIPDFSHWGFMFILVTNDFYEFLRMQEVNSLCTDSERLPAEYGIVGIPHKATI